MTGQRESGWNSHIKGIAMNITCNHCQTRYKLDSTLAAGKPRKVRCSVCRYVFTINGNGTKAPVDRPSRKKPTPNVQVREALQDGARAQKGAPAAGARPAARPLGNAPRVIAVSNQKGGVAKTTTCLNLGMALALLHQRVLLVDFDVQANLTVSLGKQSNGSLYQGLTTEGDGISASVVPTGYRNLWLLPADKKMVLLDKEYLQLPKFEYCLKSQLNYLQNQYDYILVDTPPSIGFFTLNALTAAQMTIIPCQCDFFATQGVDQSIKIIDLVKHKTNPAIDYTVLTTMYDHVSTASRLIRSRLAELHGKKSLRTTIAMDSKVRESQILRQPVLSYDKSSEAGRQYLQLAREIMKG